MKKKEEKEKDNNFWKNLKVGDEVYIKRNIEEGKFYNNMYVNDNMANLSGEKHKLHDIRDNGELKLEEGKQWIWTTKMFSKSRTRRLWDKPGRPKVKK